MTNLSEYLSTNQWLYFHEKDNPDSNDPNSALAYQDTFVRWILDLNTHAQKPYGVFHFYPSNYAAVLLGAKDTRLANLRQGVQFLKDHNHQVVVRPHGGLAVISDPGVLNVALVSDTDHFPLSIDEGYEQMVALIQESLATFQLKVESYEVVDSYCPGKFDLVINGKKIGGVAQRRFKSGVAIAAYLSVNGYQHSRGELIQTFYRLSEATDDFPMVNPESMTTISDLMGQELSLTEYENILVQILEKYSVLHAGNYQDASLVENYQKVLEKTLKRTQKIN